MWYQAEAKNSKLLSLREEVSIRNKALTAGVSRSRKRQKYNKKGK